LRETIILFGFGKIRKSALAERRKMKKFIYKDDEECCSHDLIVNCECNAHILRILKYNDDESLSLMHYSCGLPENVSENTLCWDVLLSKKQALSLASSILEIYGDDRQLNT
jgi:hypothetical protein